MAAEQKKDPGAITQTAAGGSTAVKPHHHKPHKGPSVKEHLGHAFEYVKANTPRGTGLFLGIGVAAVLILLLFRYFWLSSAATASGRWLRLDDAAFVTEVEAVAKDPELKDTEQARLARLVEARMRLDGGLKNLGINREQARKDIEAARTLYTDLSKSPGRTPLVQQEALWGAAKASESLGDIAGAVERYQQLVKDHAASALGKDAKKQLERLNDPDTKKELDALRDLFKPGAGG